MKNLNWTKIPNNKIGSTIFGQLSNEKLDIDFAEMEVMFGKKIIEKKEDGEVKRSAVIHPLQGRRHRSLRRSRW